VKLALVALAALCCSCSPAAQQTEAKVATAAIQVSLKFCRLDVDNQPATPGWEALLCQLDEFTAQELGVASTQVVVPAGTMAKLAAGDAGGGS
jgi:hypothetical protein